MSVSSQLQLELATRLAETGALRVAVPIVRRREKEMASEIAAAVARSAGLCAYVMPLMAMSVQDEMPFIFVDRGEIRVRVIEQPAKNRTGVDAYQLAEDVVNALHWHLSPLLGHPLMVAPEVIEHVSDRTWRIVDVIFNAVYALPKRVVPVWESGDEGSEFGGLSRDLRAAVMEQLTAGLENSTVPVRVKPEHDLGDAIGASGWPISIQVASPIPKRAMQGVPFVFFERYEVRVKIIEQPALNGGADAYDLLEDVMTTLHWQPFAGLLAHPLQLARNPSRLVDDPARREIEVVFNATCGFLAAEEAEQVRVTDDFGVVVTDDAGVVPTGEL